MALSVTDVINNSVKLQRFWGKRDKKFKEWYGQIRMLDTLAQREMESFVGNDPRAAYNLISYILEQKIPHRLPPGILTAEQVAPAAQLSSMFDTIWENISESYRTRGRRLLRDIIRFVLATGWYSVFAVPSTDGSFFMAEAWHPITVYPMWTDILSECVHVFTPGKAAVESMVNRNGWSLVSSPSDNTVVYDYWWVERKSENSVVHNSIVVGNEQVKPDTTESRFGRIPIFVAPCGGLPDTGEMAGDNWKAETGQSFIATNENILKTFNRWWTFMMQLLRDTAQPRTYEKTSSAKQIVQPETWYRRGAHYKIGLQDEIGFISPPPIPVEFRNLQLDLEAMRDRGGPSSSMFGSITNRMTSYAMSQVAATTNQLAKDYHTGIIDCLSDIDNFFYALIKENKYKPYALDFPQGLPETAKLTAEYELRIPGDLVQRATTARMLNPEFEISDERIMEELFPEIKNPTEELGKIRASKARKHPIYATISLAEALKQEALLLRNGGDTEGADLYEKAAARVGQEIIGQQEQETLPGEGAQPRVRVRPEVSPPTEPRVPGGR